MIGRIEQRVDLCDGHSFVRLSHLHDFVAGALEEPEHRDRHHDGVHEQRLIAETMISRPVMKAYKAMLRASGVLATAQSEQSAEDI